MIEECDGVLKRKKFRKCLSEEDISEFVAIHIKLCRMIELKNVPEAFTDKKDNFLLALYETGNATALVTGDKLLIKEANHKNIQVINWQQFRQLFGD